MTLPLLQEQGAEDMIMQAAAKGQWAHLTNVHLARQWMPKLISIIRHLHDSHPDPQFRLWLSLSSGVQPPVGLLHSCLVVALERPQVIPVCSSRIEQV